MNGPRLNAIAIVGSVLIIAGFFVFGDAIESRAREPGNWNFACLIAPCLQVLIAGGSLLALAVSVRRGRMAETLFGTLTVLLLTWIVVQSGVGGFRRYSSTRPVAPPEPREGRVPQRAAAPVDTSLWTVADLARDYKKLRLVTPQPVFVNPGLAMLCTGPTRPAVEEARRTHGVHAHTSVSIYMNDRAAAAFRQKATAYPVGSVVVKEKHALPYRHDAEDSVDRSSETADPDGVGGMVKRPPGYDLVHGDWEYFYFEDPAKIETGRIAACVDCHAGAAATDHVFGGWAKGSSRRP